MQMQASRTCPDGIGSTEPTIHAAGAIDGYSELNTRAFNGEACSMPAVAGLPANLVDTTSYRSTLCFLSGRKASDGVQIVMAIAEICRRKS